MALCQTYDHIAHRALPPLRNRPYVGQFAATVFLAFSIVAFTIYAPLAYGNMWTKSECKRVKLFNTWDWDCNNFYPTYQDYYISAGKEGGSDSVPSSDAPPAPAGGEQGLKDDPKAGVTPLEEMPPNMEEMDADEPGVIRHEEKVEYRDEEGNLLNEEQVKELEGKVSFKTRYETRTRIVDADGNELYEGSGEEAGPEYEEDEEEEGDEEAPEGLTEEEFHRLLKEGKIREEDWAPPHPDVQGQNPETKEKREDEASKEPPRVEASLDDEEKQGREKQARPASDAQEATKGEL